MFSLKNNTETEIKLSSKFPILSGALTDYKMDR